MDSGLPQNLPSLPTRGGKLIFILTWFLLTISLLAVVTRLLAKRSLKKPFGMDDIWVLMAFILNIGSAIAIAFQNENGLGQPFQSLDASEQVALLKSIYAFEMLAIAVVCMAKLSIANLLLILSPVELHQYLTIATAAAVVLWWIVCEFATAFQCHPQVWNFIGNSCIDRISLWYFISIFSILTDIMLLGIPFIIVRSLSMRPYRKVLVVGSFASRLVDVAVAGTQIAYTPELALGDPSYGLWPWILILDVMQCTSIVTSCLPYLRQLIEIIPSGMYTSDEIRRRIAAGSLAGRSSGSGSQGSALKPGKRSRAVMDRIIQLSNISRTNAENITRVTATGAREPGGTASYDSQSHIIKQTTFETTSHEA